MIKGVYTKQSWIQTGGRVCVHGDVHRILVFVSILTIRLYDYKMCAMKFF